METPSSTTGDVAWSATSTRRTQSGSRDRDRSGTTGCCCRRRTIPRARRRCRTTVAASAWSPRSRAARNAPKPISSSTHEEGEVLHERRRAQMQGQQERVEGAALQCSPRAAGPLPPRGSTAARRVRAMHGGRAVPTARVRDADAPSRPGGRRDHRHAVAGTLSRTPPTEHAARDLPRRAERPVRERDLVVAEEDDQADHHDPTTSGSQRRERRTGLGTMGRSAAPCQRSSGSVASPGGATAGAW